jgi:maltooligosyltrehalose trehalohydrolase
MRCGEFAGFAEFSDPAARKRIPDPNAESTFQGSKLDWGALDQPEHARWYEWYKSLIEIRNRHIVPRLAGMTGDSAAEVQQVQVIAAHWAFRDGGQLSLLANLGDRAVEGVDPPTGERLFETSASAGAELAAGRMGPWTVAWTISGPA